MAMVVSRVTRKCKPPMGPSLTYMAEIALSIPEIHLWVFQAMLCWIWTSLMKQRQLNFDCWAGGIVPGKVRTGC